MIEHELAKQQLRHKLPQHTLASLDRWVQNGRRGGHFLDALISNDLQGVYSHADLQNRQAIGDLVTYLYNYCPSECWGSKEALETWTGLSKDGDSDRLD